jgi:hypothetical protein
VAYWGVHGCETKNGVTKRMGRSRTPATTERVRIFIGIAAALWLVAAIAAVIDGDTLQAVSWFCLAAFGGLCAGGFVHGRQGVAYLAIGLLVVAVAISMGVFIAD